jgi:polyisoprenoid-binding protein YceI
MSKKFLIGIGIGIVVIVVGIAVYVLRPVAEASAPIEALPVEVEQVQDKVESGMDQPAGVVVFTILQESSEVRFSLDELLRGNPTTVVGLTNQVAGEIAIDFDDPGSAKVGKILVNARTLVTDNDFRNRAIKNEILDTDEFEFIIFTPTTISGFAENAQFGEALAFQITGELTIRDITNEVTFDVSITAESETRLSGSASTVVLRADYDLKIPDVPSVADVDEEVVLEIDFVATVK